MAFEQLSGEGEGEGTRLAISSSRGSATAEDYGRPINHARSSSLVMRMTESGFTFAAPPVITATLPFSVFMVSSLVSSRE